MTTTMTELNQRHSNGITVTLLWNPANGEIAVHVHDEPAQQEFQLACAPNEAMNVFHHPYAYADARHTRTTAAAPSSTKKPTLRTPRQRVGPAGQQPLPRSCRVRPNASSPLPARQTRDPTRIGPWPTSGFQPPLAAPTRALGRRIVSLEVPRAVDWSPSWWQAARSSIRRSEPREATAGRSPAAKVRLSRAAPRGDSVHHAARPFSRCFGWACGGTRFVGRGGNVAIFRVSEA